MKKLLILTFFISGTCLAGWQVIPAHALVISEVMSNPVGTDDGREWVEVFNNTESAVDLSGLTISIKGGNYIVVTPVQGGTTLEPNAYAIIGSTVSSQTKFLQDYSNYTGILLKSSIGLVNTGITSIDIKLSGATSDSLSSYTPAKEGHTLALINNSFTLSDPTPGTENQPSVSSNSSTSTISPPATTDNQTTVAQRSPPSPDIVFYMPNEKIVIAGAETDFSTRVLTRSGKKIDGLICNWSFGDGGQSEGTSTKYRYAYPGRYIAQVEGNNGYVTGVGRMTVRVVPPDIFITKIDTGKYGLYVDILNPNNYDLDLSQWKLSINGSIFPFPKNTLIAGNGVTHFSGASMGFANMTLSPDMVVKILFPNQEEVTRFILNNKSGSQGVVLGTSTVKAPLVVSSNIKSAVKNSHKITPIEQVATTTQTINKTKDRRIADFFKSLFRW